MQKIINYLWYDHQAEEAAAYYTSIFKNAGVTRVSRYGEAGAAASGMEKGSVMEVIFELEGQVFAALNGGPVFSFTPAISLLVNCIDQEEVDNLWSRLSEGGEIQPCGWVKDKFGVSWQIVPKVLEDLLNDSDPDKVEKVMKAMLTMTRLDIETLVSASQS
jgi:predicted 3-demethylubiquinone-9 3-methyltransferase (glyoxalase superfamily)